MTPVAEIVRRHDPDRYFCALFAPATGREALMTLYAFNHELARASEVAREPGLALIRLQWWREIVEGARRRHEVAGPLGALIDASGVPVVWLDSMIEAREEALQDEPADFTAMMRRGPGALTAAAGAVLGASAAEQDSLVRLGAGCGMAGMLRNALLAPDRFGWAVLADRATALALLEPCTTWRRPVVAAALPAVLARRDLMRGQAVVERGLADRLAVVRAVVTSVI